MTFTGPELQELPPYVSGGPPVWWSTKGDKMVEVIESHAYRRLIIANGEVARLTIERVAMVPLAWLVTWHVMHAYHGANCNDEIKGQVQFSDIALELAFAATVDEGEARRLMSSSDCEERDQYFKREGPYLCIPRGGLGEYGLSIRVTPEIRLAVGRLLETADKLVARR